ncbi:hypothetical protein D9M69_566280 [compost metagenome]
MGHCSSADSWRFRVERVGAVSRSHQQPQHDARQGQVKGLLDAMVLGDIAGQRRSDTAAENLANAHHQTGGGRDQRRWHRLAGERPDDHADHAEVEEGGGEQQQEQLHRLGAGVDHQP